MSGEELIWVVGKALVAFIVCWVVIGWFAGVLSLSVEGQYVHGKRMRRYNEEGQEESRAVAEE